MSVDLSGFDNPDEGRPRDEQSPMLGLKPFLEAASRLERSVGVIKDTQTKTNSHLDSLNKTLNRLVGVLGKTGSGGRGGSTSGHSYGQNGGGATFGGQPLGGGSGGGGGQPPKPPNGGHQPGGGGPFSWKYNPQPSATAPGTFARTVAALGGNTPKAWGTKYAPLEMSAQVVAHAGQQLASRGLSQMGDQYLLEESFNLSRQRGATITDLDGGTGLTSGILGTRRNTAGDLDQTAAIGRDALSGAQNVQDAFGANDLAERFAGGLSTNRGQTRWSATMRSAAGLTYANPGMSLTQATQVTTQLIKPSNRLRMVMMGLPDPTDSSGAYKGNAQFFAAFLKRMYMNDHVPTNVFDDDFRESGIGWANLVNVVGEEGAAAMLEPMRAYNRAKASGKDTSDFDQLFLDASKAGKEYDKSREQLKTKYGIEDSSSRLKQRQNALSRASEMSGNSEYIEAERNSAEAMHLFADAVHKFVNAPIIGDIANFLKGAAPGAMSVAGSANAGLLSINGMMGLSSQGPEDKPGGGPAPVTSGSGRTGADDLVGKVVNKATSYATGSRKYKYSMPLRNRDGYFDCSSFVSRVYSQFGYRIGPTTVQMWKQGTPVDLDDVQPGDLLLWARGKPGTQSGGAEHVEMYIGNGKTVGTARAKPGQNTIQIQPYRKGDWDAARRIIGSSKRGKSHKDPSDPTSLTTSTSKDGGSGLFDNLSKGLNNALGAFGLGGDGGGSSAGSGTAVAGLGAANAMAYSTSELEALTSILSGGGGGGVSPGSEGTDTEGATKLPYEARGTQQEPGDSAEGKKTGKRPSKDVKEGKIRLDPNGRTRNYTPEKHPAPNPATNKAIARTMLASMGWEQHWAALEKLWTRESSWNQYADNASSDAYGIPQSLPGTKMASAGSDWRTNPATQIKWGLNYIKGRYGTPTRAWAHSQAKGWYDVGAWQVPDEQEAVVHKDEMIIPARQAQTIRDALIKENLGGAVTGERANTPSADGGNVSLHFASGSIVLSFADGVTERAGRGAARGFIKELERHELWKDIAKGGGQVIRARA
ncbi:hypothetical protein GCM10010149_89280 [Nonomuraea roseoviolacea subsp. roseoviolacea]